MAIPKLTNDLAIISKLGDNPGTDNGLSTSAFRAKFDEAGLIIQQYINDVLTPSVDASADPSGGLSMRGPINMNGQKLSGIKDPVDDGDAVPKSYVDAVKVTSDNAQKKQKVFTATILANGWTDHSTTCTQYVTMNGLLATDTFFVDIDLLNIASGTAMAELNEAWSAIYCSQCRSDGQLFVEFSLEDKPSIDIPVKVVAFEV